MNAVWDFIEISINFFQGFIMIYFSFAYLENKSISDFVKSAGIWFVMALALLITAMNHIFFFEHFYAFLYVGLIFIYTVFCLKGNVLSKIFAAVFPVLVVLVISALVSSFASFILKWHLSEVLQKNSLQRLIALIITQLLILYTLLISLKIMKQNNSRNHQLEKSEWFFISAGFLLSILIGALLNFIALDNISKQSRTYIAAIFLGLVILNIVIFYLTVHLEKKNVAVRENELLKITQAYNKQYVKNSQVEYELIRKLRHDSKDQYNVVYDLIVNQKYEQAKEYIEKIHQLLSEKEIFVHTKNDVVNAIVNAKLTVAKSFGITVSCISVDEFDGIDDVDLCRLLSNMLENAITATKSCNFGKKCIELKMTKDEFQYIFHVKNSIENSVLKTNPLLNTIKKGDKKHGYGVSIIKDIAKKYNGRYDFYEEDEYFCCLVKIDIN